MDDFIEGRKTKSHIEIIIQFDYVNFALCNFYNDLEWLSRISPIL